MAAISYRSLFTALLVASLVVVRGVFWFFPQPEKIFRFIPLRCPIHLIFGVRCPTCGLGHSLIHAWAGNWRESWSHHPIGILLLGLSLVMVLGSWIVPLKLKEYGRVTIGHLSRPLPFAIIVSCYLAWGVLRA